PRPMMPTLIILDPKGELLLYDEFELDHQYQRGGRDADLVQIEAGQVAGRGEQRLGLVANFDLEVLRDAARHGEADAADVVGILRRFDVDVVEDDRAVFRGG